MLVALGSVDHTTYLAVYNHLSPKKFVVIAECQKNRKFMLNILAIPRVCLTNSYFIYLFILRYFI